MGYLGTKPSNSPLTSELIPNSIITNAKINDVAATKLTGQVADANAPSGSVIQVVSTTKTDTFSTSSTSFVDVTGLDVTITPSSATSRIYISFNFVRGANSAALTSFRLVRDSTPIGNGTPEGNRVGAIAAVYAGTSDVDAHNLPCSGTFVDSPNTTSAITYKIQVLCQPSMVAWVGRSARDTNLAEFGRSSSTITVMEISA
jgi:hypothetical protein